MTLAVNYLPSAVLLCLANLVLALDTEHSILELDVNVARTETGRIDNELVLIAMLDHIESRSAAVSSRESSTSTSPSRYHRRKHHIMKRRLEARRCSKKSHERHPDYPDDLLPF